SDNRSVFFMFSGQGSQYQGMARDLYRSNEVSGISVIFKRHLTQVLQLLPSDEKQDFIDTMFGYDNPQKINATEFSQFSLFAVSYALAQTLIEIGITPNGMLGHSIGEITAATISGVF